MNSNQLKALLIGGKSQHLELKSKISDLSVIARMVCGFLNSGGGRIVLGVGEQGKVIGLPKAQEISDSLQNYLAESINPSAVWSISVESFEDGNIMIIDIPNGANKPYLFDQTVYVRCGSITATATPGEISNIVEKRSKADQRWERQPAPSISLEDLDIPEIMQTAKFASNKRGWKFQNAQDPLHILEDLGLLHWGQLTNAAVILFAKNAARIFPQSRVRVTVYESDKLDSRIRNDRVFGNHLFYNLKNATDFVENSVDIVLTFTPGEYSRRDKPRYPFASVREGIINALMHRDLNSPSGSTTINIYPNRMEIWNYGSLPEELTVADLKKNHPSLPPNPDISQVCFLRGVIDLIGRGTQKILDECKKAGLQTPKWRTGQSGTTLTIYGLPDRHSLASILNDRQWRAIKSWPMGKLFSLKDYMKLSGEGITDRTARTDLARLKENGLIAHRGRGRNTRYFRTDMPAPEA